jgi:ubiquinone/menaquinone biosynthesis C-methylase UbiE
LQVLQGVRRERKMRRVLATALRFVLIVLGLAFLWLTVARILRRFFRFPAPAIIGYGLDSDLRRRFQPPAQIIERSGFETGMRVLEVGCGSGAYTTFVARAVGNQGGVVALDIQPAMLTQLQRKLGRPENRDIQNVRLVEGSACGLPFEEASVDLVYMITVLPEIPDQARALAEAKRVLRPGGILALTEFLPDPDYPSRRTTVRRGKEAALELEGVYGSAWTYTVRFRKRADTG